jgi:hypothetical protein
MTREQRDQYGSEVLNAEELIRATQSAHDPVLQRVLNIATDDEATAEVMDNLASWADKFDLDDGEILMAAAVHGNALVGVIDQPDGRHRKVVVGYTEDWEPPRLTADEARRRAAALAEQQVARETAKARGQAQQRVLDAEAEAAEWEAERIAEIREASAARVREAEQEIEAGQETAPTREPGAAAVTEEPASERKQRQEPTGDPVWPEHHVPLDELAAGAQVELPEDWAGRDIASKQEFLAQAGVRPGQASS